MVQSPSGNYIFSSFEIGLSFSLPIGPKGGLTEIDQNGNHVRSALYNNSNGFTTEVQLSDVKNITVGSTGNYIVTGEVGSQCLIFGVRLQTATIIAKCQEPCKSPESCQRKNPVELERLIAVTIASVQRGFESD